MKSATLESSSRRFLLALAGGLCASAMASFGQDLGTNLVNYWDFQTNYQDKATAIFGSGSTAADTGTPGTGNSLIVGSGPGGMPNYANFNRANPPCYITVPATSDIYLQGKSLTVSVWVRISSFSQNFETVFAQGDSTGNYRLARGGDKTWLNFTGGGTDVDSLPVTDGNWHHIVCISEVGVGVRLWQDGVQIASRAANGNLANNTGTARMLIGANPGADTGSSGANQFRQWGGDIADMAMWTRVLTPLEIANIYSKGSENGKNLATVIAETPALDSDGDGLPDWWETKYGLDPNDPTGDNGAAGDPDGDGRTNLQEYQNYNGQRATNPKSADTDGDGATDGLEFTAGTNPLVADTDGDGLTDGAEMNTYHTNPLLADTDGDGVSDGAEVTMRTDPLVANSGLDFGLLMNLPFNANTFNRVDSDVHWTTHFGHTCYPVVGTVAMTDAGKFGTALNVANSAYLQVQGDENLFDFKNSQSMSCSVWFTVNQFNNNDATLVAKGNGTGNFRINRSGSTSFMSANGGSGNMVATNVFPQGDGIWHHAVLVSRYGVNTEFWIDGVLQGTNAAPALGDSTYRLYIGSNPQFTGNRWNGLIDDLAVWNRPLSSTEIATLWNDGAGREISSFLTADSEGTGVPDYWRLEYFGHPDARAGDLSRAGDDADGDGLTNLQEFQFKTDPTRSDTEPDTATDLQEFVAGSDPLAGDTDGDGLTDGQEINTYLTSPLLADTDSDGINDPVELAQGTNPVVANPGLDFGLVLNMPMDNDFNSGVNQAFYNNALPVRANTVTASPVGTVTRTAGKFGNAATLTGAGYLSVNGIENVFDFQGGAQSMTVSLWCKASALDTSNQCLIAKGDYTDTWRITRNGTNNFFQANGGGGDLAVVGGGAGYTTINTDVWHHVVLVSKYLNTAELWVDGVLQQSGTVPNLRNSDKRLFIGENSGALNRRWKGQINDLAIWRRALSPTEIASIYNSGTGAPIDTLIGADTDGDGMPDWWEKQFALDPNTDDAGSDADGDGLTNLQEYQAHAPDPRVADTDGDGLNDGPELIAGSNPLLADTDGDGLTDAVEVNTSLTNPALADTDGDGMNDGAEVALGSPPLVANLGFGFGMMAYFPMDADFNAVNSGVNGFTTTVQGSGVVSAPGKFGNAVSMGGSGGLQVEGDENPFDFQPINGAPMSWSVSMWFTLDSAFSKDWQTLIAKGNDGATWRLARHGNNPYLNWTAGPGTEVNLTTVIPTANPTLWHHMVINSKVNEGTDIWYDGVKVSTSAGPALGNVTSRVWIGNNSTATGRQWQGKIDDVGIWRRALTATQIGQLWNSGRSIDGIINPIPQITNSNSFYDQGTDSMTLTWSSAPNHTYQVLWGTDVADINNILIPSIDSGGAFTTHGPFPNPIPNAPRMFFRVKQN